MADDETDTVEVRLESGKFAVLPAGPAESPETHSAGATFEVDADALDEHPQLVPVAELDDEAESEAEPEGEAFDAEAFVDVTPMDSVVEDIENGDVDDHLDAVEAAAEREGVQDAVADRRDELEDDE